MERFSLHRVGAVCAILGAIMTGAFNGMHPELAEPAGIVRNAATVPSWTLVHWGLIVGMVLMQLGYSALAQTLRTQASDNAENWGTLGVSTLTVGLALWICVFAAEAALKPLIDSTKSERLGSGGLALGSLVDAMATAATFVYWLGIALLGVALLVSKRYPRWVGAAGLALGAALSLSVGLVKAFSGASDWTERYGFQTLAILFLVWTLVLGVLLWRGSHEYAEIRADQ